MIPVIIQLGPFPLNSFGLLMVCAFLAAWRRLYISLDEAGEKPELAEKMILWAAVAGILGARVNFLFSFHDEFFRDPIATALGSAGFVFYGGLIGGFVAVWVLLRREGRPFLRFGDLSAPALALGYAVGRIGCHLSGDGDYGIVSNLPWAVSYVAGVIPTPPGVRVHPTPIYETLVAFGITYVLLTLQRKHRFTRDGQLFGLYFLLSALSRFFVEFIRIEPMTAYGITEAQVASIGGILLGAALLLLPIGPLISPARSDPPPTTASTTRHRS